jgi:hypothetical protein
MIDRHINGSLNRVFIFGENPALKDPGTYPWRPRAEVGGITCGNGHIPERDVEVRSRGSICGFVDQEGGNFHQ